MSGVSAKFSIGQFTSFNWYMRDTSQPQNVENRDVSEFESEFECYQNMTISGKSDRFTDSFTSYSDLPFVAWSSHSSFPSIICHTEVNKYTLNGCFFDVCITLNAKWDWDVSSDLEFNIMQTSINSYSMEQAMIARQIQIRQIWSTESESDGSRF